MVRKNVYMNDQTRYVVEGVMAQEGIETHTEAVRFIVDHYEDRFINQRLERMENEIISFKKDLLTISNLLVYISESMSATPHDRQLSNLYTEALLKASQEVETKRLHDEMKRSEWNL